MSAPTHFHDFYISGGGSFTACGVRNTRRRGVWKLSESKVAELVTCRNCQTSARFINATAAAAPSSALQREAADA